MSDTQSFFRTIVEVEVVSDFRPDPEMSLHTLAAGIDTGPFSGRITRQDSWEISEGFARELLLWQGSDPAFLIIEDAREDERDLGTLEQIRKLVQDHPWTGGADMPEMLALLGLKRDADGKAVPA